MARVSEDEGRRQERTRDPWWRRPCIVGRDRNLRILPGASLTRARAETDLLKLMDELDGQKDRVPHLLRMLTEHLEHLAADARPSLSQRDEHLAVCLDTAYPAVEDIYHLYRRGGGIPDSGKRAAHLDLALGVVEALVSGLAVQLEQLQRLPAWRYRAHQPRALTLAFRVLELTLWAHELRALRYRPAPLRLLGICNRVMLALRECPEITETQPLLSGVLLNVHLDPDLLEHVVHRSARPIDLYLLIQLLSLLDARRLGSNTRHALIPYLYDHLADLALAPATDAHAHADAGLYVYADRAMPPRLAADLDEPPTWIADLGPLRLTVAADLADARRETPDAPRLPAPLQALGRVEARMLLAHLAEGLAREVATAIRPAVFRKDPGLHVLISSAEVVDLLLATQRMEWSQVLERFGLTLTMANGSSVLTKVDIHNAQEVNTWRVGDAEPRPGEAYFLQAVDAEHSRALPLGELVLLLWMPERRIERCWLACVRAIERPVADLLEIELQVIGDDPLVVRLFRERSGEQLHDALRCTLADGSLGYVVPHHPLYTADVKVGAITPQGQQVGRLGDTLWEVQSAAVRTFTPLDAAETGTRPANRPPRPRPAASRGVSD